MAFAWSSIKKWCCWEFNLIQSSHILKVSYEIKNEDLFTQNLKLFWDSHSIGIKENEKSAYQNVGHETEYRQIWEKQICSKVTRVRFKDTLNAFSNFKNKQKSMKWCFLICKSMYILKAYSVHYTLRQNINFTNTPSDKMVQKMHSFFFHELQLIKVLILICDFYMSWSTRFVSVKLCVGFSIFDSVSFLLKFVFLFNKMHGLLDFKTL